MATKKSKAAESKKWIELARKGLDGIATEEQVGDFLGFSEVDGVFVYRFASKMSGYPGWEWTVALYAVDGEEPTVLEAELLAGDGSLLAPPWVPWAERLEIWKASQEAAAAENAEDDDSDSDDEDDDDSDDIDEDIDEDDDDMDEDDVLNSDTDHQLDEVVDNLMDDESDDDSVHDSADESDDELEDELDQDEEVPEEK